MAQERGRVLQCNEGKWDFELEESNDGQCLVLSVAVGPHIDTSHIRVDVQPLLIRLLIKVGRLLLVRCGLQTASKCTAVQLIQQIADLVLQLHGNHTAK